MSKTQTSRWSFLPLLLIPMAAGIAIWPLLRDGCSCGHDFDFHLLNWIEVAEHWRAGVLYPHWERRVAWGAGEPVFVFYPPLSWLLGGTLGALASAVNAAAWQWVPIAYSFMVLTAAGFSAYALARSRTSSSVSQTTAILAAVVYVVNPYMLFVVYERTAYGELLAAVWLPLLLRALIADEIDILGIAVPIALLWLSNAPGAVMGCYTLALAALVRAAMLWRSSRKFAAGLRLAAKAGGGLALGVGLAAFYIFPAAYEQRWVQIENALVPGLNPAENFLFGHTSDPNHDAVLLTASWVAIAVITLTVALLVATWFRIKQDERHVLILPAAITLAICIVLMPVSLPLWLHLPQLEYLQFPWRFLVVLGTVMTLAIALALPHAGRRWLVLAVAIPLLAVPVGYHIFQQSCEDDDEAAIEMQGGGAAGNLLLVEPIDEYTPHDADETALQTSQPPYWLATTVDENPGAANPSVTAAHENEITEVHNGIEDMRYQTRLATPQLLVLRLWDYPAWRVTVNGRVLDQRPERDDGLMAIPLPAGNADIDVRYARTWDRTVGQVISVAASLAALLLWCRRSSAEGTP